MNQLILSSRMIKIISFICCFLGFHCMAQDLSLGYIKNDLQQRPMQNVVKPNFLQAIIDPSFPSTKIRRISDAAAGNFIVPMYSTIQSWNADESLMLIYGGGVHKLLDGQDYTFKRDLIDINPNDLEAVFWSFINPDILYYMDNDNLYSYHVQTKIKTSIANIRSISNCASNIVLTGGNDIQMMSWNDDVFSFRCGNDTAYYYRVSTNTITSFNITNINNTAPMPFPSGNLFFHLGNVYNTSGSLVRRLNTNGIEHACLGKLSNGDDAYFAIGFEEGPDGDCQGTLVAHNATTGHCFSVTPVSNYAYPKSGTHISALAHKNSEGGWVAVSSIGYQKDGVQILDQELFVAKINEFNGDVYRVAHHRSDEDNIDYWGEPHVTISPTGTRLLFGSDWSGQEDGISVDSYVAELNSFTLSATTNTKKADLNIKIYSELASKKLRVLFNNKAFLNYTIFNVAGQEIKSSVLKTERAINISGLSNGLYFIKFQTGAKSKTLKFLK